MNISENSLIQQVYDRAKITEPIEQKKTPLNFNSVEKLEDDRVEVGSIYVDILDSGLFKPKKQKKELSYTTI